MNPRHAVLETAALPTELYPYVLAPVYYTHSRAVCKGVFQKKFHDRKKPLICTPLPPSCLYNPPPPFGQSPLCTRGLFSRLTEARCPEASLVQREVAPQVTEGLFLRPVVRSPMALLGRAGNPAPISEGFADRNLSNGLGDPIKTKFLWGSPIPSPARKPCKADSTLLSFSYEIISIKRSQNYEHRMVG